MIGQDFRQSKPWFRGPGPLFAGTRPPHIRGQGRPGSMNEHTLIYPNLAHCDGASIAVLSQNKVLLVRRKRAPSAGLWSLPGGKIEAHETPREGARRELKEETGLEADVEGVLDRVAVAASDQTYRLTVFYGRLTGGALNAGG